MRILPERMHIACILRRNQHSIILDFSVIVQCVCDVCLGIGAGFQEESMAGMLGIQVCNCDIHHCCDGWSRGLSLMYDHEKPGLAKPSPPPPPQIFHSPTSLLAPQSAVHAPRERSRARDRFHYVTAYVDAAKDQKHTSSTNLNYAHTNCAQGRAQPQNSVWSKRHGLLQRTTT